jgi:hypothetical protein
MRAEWDKRFPFTSAIAADPYQAAGFVERVLAAWQADRDALEAASQKAQLYDEFPWGEIARDAHGFPVTADDWETVKASHRNLEALVRRAREALNATVCALQSGDEYHQPGVCEGCDATRAVLAELDAAQGEN